MHHIIVCDDNEVMVSIVISILKKYTSIYDIEVVGFSNKEEVIKYCRNNQFDIVYMDIKLGEDNGMSLAQTIKMIAPDTLIIYISAYDSYYREMVQAEPFRFVRKVSDRKEFEEAVIKALDAAVKRLNRNKYWSFVFDRQQYIIKLDDIKYFYSSARTIHIVGDIADVPNYYYGKMDNLQEEVEKLSECFVRINKSHIVNLSYVSQRERKHIKVDDVTLSITSKYRKSFEEKMMRYWDSFF